MPSRPPLLFELEPSTSGIIQDPHTGDRKVAPTKRPDGTLRKEIKIRPGFTPQEDVSKFRSARQNEFQSKQLPRVVGFIRPQEAVTHSALKGMSEAQKKNAKRKEKRKAAKPDTEDIPDQWDHLSTGSNPQDQQAKISSGSDTAKPIFTSKANTNPGQALFQSALKSTSSNPQPSTLQHLVPPPNLPEEPISSVPRKDEKGKEGINLFTTALQSIVDHKALGADEPVDSVKKKARAVQKRLTQAQQLKTRHEQGEKLLAEQLDKIYKIDELQHELEGFKIAS